MDHHRPETNNFDYVLVNDDNDNDNDNDDYDDIDDDDYDDDDYDYDYDDNDNDDDEIIEKNYTKYYETYYFCIRSKINGKIIRDFFYESTSPHNGLEFYFIKEYIVPYYNHISEMKKNLSKQLCKKYLNEDLLSNIIEYL